MLVIIKMWDYIIIIIMIIFFYGGETKIRKVNDFIYIKTFTGYD